MSTQDCPNCHYTPPKKKEEPEDCAQCRYPLPPRPRATRTSIRVMLDALAAISAARTAVRRPVLLSARRGQDGGEARGRLRPVLLPAGGSQGGAVWGLPPVNRTGAGNLTRIRQLVQAGVQRRFHSGNLSGEYQVPKEEQSGDCPQCFYQPDKK